MQSPCNNSMQSTALSTLIFQRGQMLLPGGVSSPGRAFSDVGGQPLVIRSGDGKFLDDVDGNRYIDFVCGLGPMILGHGHPVVTEAISSAFQHGAVFAMPTEAEYQLAETILSTSDYLERIRFTCSGTEATMTATRVARAATGRSGILKFKGGYHGHSDVLLSGGTKRKIAQEDGEAVPEPHIESSVRANTHIANYNDVESVEKILSQSPNEIAAIIVEPVPSNMGVIPPSENFLHELRRLADRSGTILIFDEVVSGFRHRYGPVADAFGVRPDLITFGKIIGGGLPVGAVGGREDLLSLLVSRGSVFQGGTFAGNPVTMLAGLAQLDVMRRDNVIDKVTALGERLAARLQHAFSEGELPYSSQHFGSLVTPILVPRQKVLRNYAEVELQDKPLFAHIHRQLLARGIALPPTIEEPIFVSACHSERDIDDLAEAYADAAVSHFKR